MNSMNIKSVLKKLLDSFLLLQRINYWRIYHKFYVKQNPYFNLKPKLLNKNGVIYVLAPSYSNLGDVAIYVKSMDYIKNKLNLPLKSILYSRQCVNKKNLLGLSVSSDDIFVVQGGGNMGDLYANEELLRQNIVKWFPQNKIISMSSSSCFRDKKKNYILERAKKVYSQHKKLTLVARDIPTQNFCLANFNCNGLLCPDMVLSAIPARKITYEKNKKVLLCLRKDMESKLKKDFVFAIETILKDTGYFFEYWDTDDLSGKNIENKAEKIDEVLNYLNNFQFVITDRYHGTILSYISKTPCIGLDNSYGKIKNGFIWFADCNYMFYAESINEIEKAIKQIEKLNVFNENENLQNAFKSLESKLVGEIYE